jgi:hypothetical protein
MQLMPRIRSTLARHPLLWWLAVAVVAGTGAMIAAGALRGVDEARRSWGETTEVWVATAAAAPGEPLSLERRSYPVAVVPPGAVRSSPAGAVASRNVELGEVIVASDVNPGGVAGLVPPGSVAIAVPTRAPQLRIGDGVAAFASGERLADGIVVDVTEEQVVLAIPSGAASALALAVPGNAVVLALLPAP